MKTKLLFLFLIVAGLSVSCDREDGDYTEVVVATPITMSVEDFRTSVVVTSPAPIEESGKIYAYKNYIFVNDMYKGIHVVDNSNPLVPKKIAFIEIIGNVDISVKGDFLYADSLTDLVVLDISDIHDVKQVKRMEGVLQTNISWPTEAAIYETSDIDYKNEIIVGWDVKTERRLKEEMPVIEWGVGEALNSFDAGNVGQGGSMARFKIVDTYLYAVDSHQINIFDITNLKSPQVKEPVQAGFDIETIFNSGEYLFLGSRRGMYIYDLSNPAIPSFVSEFQHGTACDPVVVDGDYAYVTLRGGSFCGATESGLFIVDISNIQNPVLLETYAMEEPYGLGFKDDKLFVCDGSAGLKVYNKTDVKNLQELNHFKNIITYDVIPMEEQLIMVGDQTIYQYKYQDDKISLLSSLDLK